MTREEREKALYALRKSTPIMAMTPNEFDDYIKTLNKIADWLEQQPCEDCISRAEAIKAVREAYSIYIPRMNGWEKGLPLKIDKAIYDLPSIQPKPKTDVLDKIRAEIKEWYWQADKQALAKDPCVVDAMIDLFIRTINKYKVESEE